MRTLPVLALVAVTALLACKGGWSRPPPRVPPPEPRAAELPRPPRAEPTPTVETAAPPQPAPRVEAVAPRPSEAPAPAPARVPEAPAAETSAREPLPVPVLFPPEPDELGDAESRAQLAARILDGETFSNAPPGTTFAEIEPGMSDSDVIAILGDPDAHRNYTTLKNWIPFYAGPDAHRTEWLYRARGIIVFSRDLTRPDLLAIRVLYGAEEPE